MTLHQARICLWGLAAFLVFAATLILYWGTRAPLGIGDAPGPEVFQKDLRQTPRKEALPPLKEFDSFSRLDLRPALFDAPPPPPADPKPVAAPKRPPPINFKLTGTILEPENSYALFLNPKGVVEFKKTGETIEGAEVLEISPDKVTVLYQEERIVMKIETNVNP